MKRVMLILVIVCMLVLVGGVFGEDVNSGNGIFKDINGNLIHEQTEDSLPVTGEDIFSKDADYLSKDENRKVATKDQINAFDGKKLMDKGVGKVEGDTSKGKWGEDGNSFEYGGTKLDSETLRASKSVKFMEDGSVELTSGNGNLILKNGRAIGGSLLEVNTLQQPIQSPGICSTGGGGSSGGGQGGQDPGSMLQQGMQIAQQIAGALEGLKGKGGGSNGQGSTEITSNANGGAEIKLDDGAEFYLEDEEEENQVKLAQTDKDAEAVIDVGSGLDEMLAETNVEATIYDQVTVSTAVDTPPTEILLAGIAGDSPTQEAEALSLNQEYYGISAAVISDLSGGQFVKLIQHDLGLSGEKIIVDLFKSFNSIEGDGKELWVSNGDINIKFQGMKVYYSRRIGKIPNSIGEIANLQDKERVFSLIEYRDNKARLIDSGGRISIGDMSVEHPRENGLVIARVRKDMWVER
jgi:hypothetical protein